MSEEESNEDSNNEEENEEGEENEDEEKEEDEDNEEGEEKEDDEEKEEDEGEEKEEEEDEEDDDKKKKKKKGKKDKKKEKGKGKGKDKENTKKGNENILQNKEVKNEFTPKYETSNTSNNIMFNGNDITVGNITPKKTTMQLLLEITSDMETLSSHIEKTMPIKPLPPINNDINNYNFNNNYTSNANISFANLDKEDLEIKQLINKANELSNISKLNNMKNEIKTFEDKCCQSDEENDYNNQEEDNERSDNNINYNNVNEKRNEFPYDPYKHLGYYNNLKSNNRQNQMNNNYNTYRTRPNQNYGFNQQRNNNASINSVRIKKMDELYNLPSNIKKQPIIYTQPQSKNNTMKNRMINKYYENLDNNEIKNSINKNENNNYSEQNNENENYESTNYNKNNIDKNDFAENITSSNINNNNDYKERNYENNTNIEENNNNYVNINKKSYDRDENKYERFRPRNINHAMNILLDKE